MQKMETVSRKNVNFQDNLQKSIWLKYWQGEDILIICQLFRFCIEQGAGGSSSKYSPPVSVINLSICQQWSLFTVNTNVRIANIWRKIEKEKVLGKGNEKRCGLEAKPGSEDHRSQTRGRYIDIGISLVVIYIHLSLLIVYFSWTKETYFTR